MNEVDFRNWIDSNDVNSKVKSDTVSRLKKIERELSCDIDDEYNKDECEYLLKLFVKKGKNDEMKKYIDIKLPIGSDNMSTYRYSIKQYIKFKKHRKWK